MEELDSNDIILGNNTSAISRRSIYKYEIGSEFIDEPPILITVDEYIAIEEKRPPIYNVFINEYQLKANELRKEVPARFLYIIDLIDHYASSKLRKDNKRQ